MTNVSPTLVLVLRSAPGRQLDHGVGAQRG